MYPNIEQAIKKALQDLERYEEYYEIEELKLPDVVDIVEYNKNYLNLDYTRYS